MHRKQEYPADHPDPDRDPYWFSADLAVQQPLGILPERRLRPAAADRHHSSAGRTNIGSLRAAILRERLRIALFTYTRFVDQAVVNFTKDNNKSLAGHALSSRSYNENVFWLDRAASV